ncbi:MAG TPA: hypothetical protein VMZ53_25970 [Kofleriaceae bacterium]|nr:hypothetical protein [Kofleriaceae bacterium]
MHRLIVVIAFLVAARGTAHADLSSQLYGDVRDVIEELIQTEVTTSVVTTVKVRSPALEFYMHGTLERLGSPYWGSLGRVLKDDVTVATADFVYWHVSTGGGSGDVIESAKKFFDCARKNRGDDPACKRLLEAIVTQHRPLLEVECRREKPSPDRRIACDLGLATLAALKGRGEARHHLVDAMSDIVLLEVGGSDLGERMRDVLTKWLDLPKDLPTPLLEALANPDLGAELSDEALEKRCKDWKEMQKALDDPSSPYAWLCFAITHEQLVPQLQASVVVRENGKSFSQKIDHWVIAAALKDFDSDRADDDLVYRMFADLAFDAQCPAAKDGGDAPPEAAAWPCGGKRLEPGAQVSVYWLRRPPWMLTLGQNGKFTANNLPQKFLIASVEKFRRLYRRINELRQVVPPSLEKYLFHAGKTVQPDTKKALRALHRMGRLVAELRGRWYLWSQTQNTKAFAELDVAELLEVARNSLDQATIEKNQALAFLDKQASGGAATVDIGDWLRMVMRADYRSLAMESLRSALDLRLADKSRPKETFFLSLTAYLLDNSEGVGEQVARSAFRASAKELLLSMSHRGVPRADDRLRFRITPRLMAGLSFADSYADTDGDSRRRVVAAYWPTAMVAVNDYVGLEFSGLDLIGPLTEMALRPAGTYDQQQKVALDFLRPRAGLWVAMPQFSRRVALTVGGGGRFLELKRLDDGATPMVRAQYSYKPSLMFDAGIQFVF